MAVYSAVDYKDIKIHSLTDVVKGFEAGKNEFMRSTGFDIFEFGAVGTLRTFIDTSDTVFASMLIVIIPIFVLLAFYIIMISKLKLDRAKRDIGDAEQGASRLQILNIYFIESLLLTGGALLLGPPAGLLLCRIIGASNGFLEFVQRAPLEIYISPIALCAAGAAALLFMVITLIPTFFGAGVNIVESKRKRAYRRLPFYHRYFLDVLLFGAGIYGYITIRQKLQYYDELRQHYTMSVENSEFLLYVCGVMFSLAPGCCFYGFTR